MKMSEIGSSEGIELLDKSSKVESKTTSETPQKENDCDILMESDSEYKKLNDVKNSVKYLNSKELKIIVCVIKDYLVVIFN